MSFNLSKIKMGSIEQIKTYNECCNNCKESSTFRQTHCSEVRKFYSKDYPDHLQPLAILKAARDYNPFNFCPSFGAR